MSQQVSTTIAVMGVDIGKNSFHVVGLDQRGAIVLRQRWSRGQVESRLANLPPWLEHVLPAIMDISARAISLPDRPQWAIWVTSVGTCREDRSSISSHPLADPGGLEASG